VTGPTEQPWSVIVLAKPRKKLHKLPRQDRERLVQALRHLAQDPFSMDVKPMHGRLEWRVRVGGWRVLLRLSRAERTIVIVDVGPRGDVYK
jgi:mRNA interferase RelE/StbE